MSLKLGQTATVAAAVKVKDGPAKKRLDKLDETKMKKVLEAKPTIPHDVLLATFIAADQTEAQVRKHLKAPLPQGKLPKWVCANGYLVNIVKNGNRYNVFGYYIASRKDK